MLHKYLYFFSLLYQLPINDFSGILQLHQCDFHGLMIDGTLLNWLGVHFDHFLGFKLLQFVWYLHPRSSDFFLHFIEFSFFWMILLKWHVHHSRYFLLQVEELHQNSFVFLLHVEASFPHLSHKLLVMLRYPFLLKAFVNLLGKSFLTVLEVLNEKMQLLLLLQFIEVFHDAFYQP